MTTLVVVGLLTAGTASATTPPAWANRLGPGVSVLAPAPQPPGHSSPGTAVEGLLNALNSGKLVKACPYYQPAAQAACRTGLATATVAPGSVAKNVGLGYIAIDGDRALVGLTGTFCQPGGSPKCITNHDPAAIFSSTVTFAHLWVQQVVLSNSPKLVYSLQPCVKVGRRWYVYSSSD
jgi:hypothetical protein